jgi:general secretion pathway protein A
MEVADVKKQIFNDAAVSAVHKHAGGIPRLINNICDLCLLVGANDKVAVIDEGIVKQAVS